MFVIWLKLPKPSHFRCLPVCPRYLISIAINCSKSAVDVEKNFMSLRLLRKKTKASMDPRKQIQSKYKSPSKSFNECVFPQLWYTQPRSLQGLRSYRVRKRPVTEIMYYTLSWTYRMFILLLCTVLTTVWYHFLNSRSAWRLAPGFVCLMSALIVYAWKEWVIAFTWGEKGLFAAGKIFENCLEISDIDVALRRLEIASQYKDDQPFARG